MDKRVVSYMSVAFHSHITIENRSKNECEMQKKEKMQNFYIKALLSITSQFSTDFIIFCVARSFCGWFPNVKWLWKATASSLRLFLSILKNLKNEGSRAKKRIVYFLHPAHIFVRFSFNSLLVLDAKGCKIEKKENKIVPCILICLVIFLDSIGQT